MPSRNRRPNPRTVAKVNWLPSDEPPRSRPWAYEELLFGSSRNRNRPEAREPDDVVKELDGERAELVRLQQGLDEQSSLIASLVGQLMELKTAVRDEPGHLGSRSLPQPRPSPGASDARASLSQRSRLLARCEGFQVDSPAGPMGWVEGIRYISRIDQPDLLEVRGGRFGRELLLISSEEVEEIRVAERLVRVRSAPDRGADLLSELTGRLRRALKSAPAA